MAGPLVLKMEVSTLVIYDVEDDWARTRVAEACKDFGLERVQYSCFRGSLSHNKRGELFERIRKIQRDWQIRWKKDFPESRVEFHDHPQIPENRATGKWEPAFKILIQPVCEKDLKSASYAYVYADVPQMERQRQ